MKNLKTYEGFVDDLMKTATEPLNIVDNNGFFEFDVKSYEKEPINYYIKGTLTVPSGQTYEGHIAYNYFNNEVYQGFDTEVIDEIEGLYHELEVFMEQVVDELGLRKERA